MKQKIEPRDLKTAGSRRRGQKAYEGTRVRMYEGREPSAERLAPREMGSRPNF